MPQNKYIGTKETARLTGLSMQEIYELIHKGFLPHTKPSKAGGIYNRCLEPAEYENGRVVDEEYLDDNHRKKCSLDNTKKAQAYPKPGLTNNVKF